MYNNEKIGVGIVTCNRKEIFSQLYNQVLKNNVVDFICVVKNKDYDYGNIFDTCNNNIQYINILDNINIAYYKNIALHNLMNCKCDHLFILEDDIGIKNDDVFKEYIDTAKEFKLKHLNWNSIPSLNSANSRYDILKNNKKLSVYFRLCGCFSYFHKDAIEFGGYLNYKNYNNALEHIEQYYRLSLQKMATPFYAFGDIYNSFEYLEYFGDEEKTIDTTTDEYKKNLYTAYTNFARTYGIAVANISPPTQEQMIQFLKLL